MVRDVVFSHHTSHHAEFSAGPGGDLAIGLWGGIELVYLRDDADDPFAARRRIDHSEVELGLVGGYIPYSGPHAAYTVWPLKILTLPDMDGALHCVCVCV